MRVAARRLRSLLASGRPLFDGGAVEPLRDELRWLSGLLGRGPGPGRGPRAADRPARPGARGAAVPATGRAVRIDEELESLAAARVRARRSRRSEASATPGCWRPWTTSSATRRLSPKAGRSSGAEVRQAGRQGPSAVWRSASAALDPATRAPTHGERAARDAGLHEVRKAAKRLRYSAELAATPGRRTAPEESGTGARSGSRNPRGRSSSSWACTRTASWRGSGWPSWAAGRCAAGRTASATAGCTPRRSAWRPPRSGPS